MKRSPQYDVIIVGAGAVGSALCYALAVRGLRVAMIEGDGQPATSALRTSAITSRSLAWLRSLGVWPNAHVPAAPLAGLRIEDARGQGRLCFDSAELGVSELGVIANHAALEQVLKERARGMPDTVWHGENACAVRCRDQDIQVTLAGGTLISGSLVVAADGKHSRIREQLGVRSWHYHYGQRAIVADVALGMPHEQIACQRFLPTGPVALLPATDPRKASLIWSVRTDEAERLLALPDESFNTALTDAWGSSPGSLCVVTQRESFPLAAGHASTYTGNRFALVGDAAHQVHPLAGQGVNLGFGDAETLAQALIACRGEDLGRSAALRRYERERKAVNVSMLIATHALHRAFTHRSRILSQILATGLNVTNSLNPLKAFFMRQAGSDAP
ncbi:MAG: FAD-dependent monooxygenase [Gammaproteobacteria bacterium]|nr:FAD-dependent monooxygenase [Gammaproteobacteria bacterium]